MNIANYRLIPIYLSLDYNGTLPYYIILFLIEKDCQKEQTFRYDWLIWAIMFSSLSRIRRFMRWLLSCKYSSAIFFLWIQTYSLIASIMICCGSFQIINRRIEMLCKWNSLDLHDHVGIIVNNFIWKQLSKNIIYIMFN